MGERGVFRDILFGILILGLIVELFFVLRQNERQESRLMELTKKQVDQAETQNAQTTVLRDILTELKKPGRVVVQSGSGTNNTSTTTTAPANTTKTAAKEDFMSREDWEKKYTDPKAEPGGTLYRAFRSDPGTLNPLTENDGTVSDLHQFISESLASRDFKNPDVWVPELATDWEQTQTSWGLPAKGNGKEIVEKLSAALSAPAKEWIKPSLDADGRVKLSISKLGDEYLKDVFAIAPKDSFTPVQWINTKFNQEAGDKDLPDAAKVMERFKALVATKAEFKLSGDQVWSGETGFVFRLPGDKGKTEAFVTEFLKQKEQQGPKGQVWSVDKTETFVFEDKIYITFHLRPGVKWHDGTPLTTKDYLFSFNAMKDPGVDCQPTRNYFQDCESLDSTGENTLRFTWRKLFSGAFVASASLTLLPEHIYHYTNANELNTNPNNNKAFGTGPYKLKEWLPKQRFVLERNENYWGVKPNYKQIIYYIVSESAVRLQMLKSKQLDLMGLDPAQWVNDTKKPPFGEEHGLVAQKQYDTYYNYIGWNARRPHLADKRVRQALTMSINRDRILKELLYDLGMVVSGTFYSLGPYADPNIKPWPYDPQKAAKLFAEAGWSDHDGDGFLDKNGEKFTVKIRFPAGSETGKKILVAVQSDLKKAGVDCQLDPIEWSVFLTRIKKREFDAIMLGWSLSWDPDPYQLWHSSQTENEGSNHCYFVNKEADSIIERLRITFDRDERLRLCHRFHQILHEEQPYTFMFNTMGLIAHNVDIKNMYLPLEPGEERTLYLPLGAVPDQIFSRFWWTPKQYQHNE